MIDFIQRICDEVGPRLAGSEEEKRAGNIIYDEFKEVSDEVTQEEFTCHPQGFLDFIWLTALVYLAGVVSYFLINPLLSSILIISALSIYVIQQNLLYEVVDFLFPKKTQYHIIGKIFPQKEPKKLVLLSGHHDSAYEFPLLSKLGGKSIILIILAVICSVLNILLGFAKTLLLFFGGSSQSSNPFNFMRDIQQFSVIDIIDLLQIITFPIGVIVVMTLALFLRSNNVVMGANDNLTAVAAILECGKYLSQHKPDQTEIWLVSFAGEEHMRGSKRFVSRHYKELQEREAILLNLECLSADKFLVATAENMFLATHSPIVVEKVKQAAERVNVPVEVNPLRFAGSDAANFSRKGILATTLFGLTQTGVPNYWHTLEDTPDKLSGPSIANAVEVALQFVDDVDRSN